VQRAIGAASGSRFIPSANKAGNMLMWGLAHCSTRFAVVTQVNKSWPKWPGPHCGSRSRPS
jgi:hypothetical protein